MALKMRDVTQSRSKYRTPEVRLWVRPKSGGDDYARVKKARTPAGLQKALKHFRAPSTRKAISKEGRIESQPLIAYKGYEYGAGTFFKEHPKWKATKKKAMRKKR